jgi:hypothetical protein
VVTLDHERLRGAVPTGLLGRATRAERDERDVVAERGPEPDGGPEGFAAGRM